MTTTLTAAKQIRAAEPNCLALGVKRAVDVTVSLPLVVLLSPLFLVIALAIKLDSEGPVFFRRLIIGQNRKSFMAYKLRSMIVDAHERLLNDESLLKQYQSTLKIDNDWRVTPVGRILRKTSLDEWPQLLNVLKGEMSLVGPRMLGDIELAKYGTSGDAVLMAKPGMTGLWAVSGRHTTSFEERVNMDLTYVDQWTLWLDLKILFKTAVAVVTMVGAK